MIPLAAMAHLVFAGIFEKFPDHQIHYSSLRGMVLTLPTGRGSLQQRSPTPGASTFPADETPGGLFPDVLRRYGTQRQPVRPAGGLEFLERIISSRNGLPYDVENGEVSIAGDDQGHRGLGDTGNPPKKKIYEEMRGSYSIFNAENPSTPMHGGDLPLDGSRFFAYSPVCRPKLSRQGYRPR